MALYSDGSQTSTVATAPESRGIGVVPRVPWVAGVWSINAFFLAWTFFHKVDHPASALASPFSLANEMNLGAWWSSLIPLVSGLLIFAASLNARDTKLRRGLRALSFLCVGMSADEVCSLHERMAGIWGNAGLVPFAVLGGAMLADAVRALYDRRGTLGKAWLTVLASFAILSTVAAQEYAEHNVDWPAWTLPLRMVVEEGTELTGLFVLLAAAVQIRTRIGERTEPALLRPNLLPSRRALSRILAAAALLALPVIALRSGFTTEQLKVPLRGDFGYYIPILAWVVAAFTAVGAALRASANRFAWWTLALVLIVLSAEACCHTARYALEVFDRIDAPAWATAIRATYAGTHNDIGLLWSAPLLLIATAMVPPIRSAAIAASIVAVFALAVGTICLNVPTLSLAVTYILPLGYTGWLIRRTRPIDPSL